MDTRAQVEYLLDEMVVNLGRSVRAIEARTGVKRDTFKCYDDWLRATKIWLVNDWLDSKGNVPV